MTKTKCLYECLQPVIHGSYVLMMAVVGVRGEKRGLNFIMISFVVIMPSMP